MKRNRIPYFVWALSLATLLLFPCSKDDSSESVPGKQIILNVPLAGISENDEATELALKTNLGQVPNEPPLIFFYSIYKKHP